MTTNGVGLAKTARALADAGLTRVNVSIDTLRRDIFLDQRYARNLDVRDWKEPVPPLLVVSDVGYCIDLYANFGHPQRYSAFPDQRAYRVDTYIVSQTPPSGRPVKLITIVVRRGSDLGMLARVSSSFDESSGL